MRPIFLAAVAALSFATQAAHADVIYNWVPLSGSGNASGTLDINDGAFAGGSLTWNSDYSINDPNPPSGPVSMNFVYYGSAMGVIHGDAAYGDFSVSLTQIGNLLSGSIDATNPGNSISMGGNGVWTIGGAMTDAGGPCGEPGNSCSGDTGRWVLAQSQNNVPEPASAAALLGGLTGLFLSRKRR